MIVEKNGLYLSWNRLDKKWELTKDTLLAFRFENEKQMEKIIKKYKIKIEDYEKVG